MINLLREDIEKLAPPPSSKKKRRVWEGYINALVEHGPQLLEKYDVTTRDRFLPFIANVAHECQRFQIIHESLYYTTWKRLSQIFGAGRHSAAIQYHERHRYLRNERELAERVYGLDSPGRKYLELGNTVRGDAFKYRGTGPQQITGKRDHFRYANEIGIEPPLLAEPIYGIEAALLEWDRKGCNALADKGEYRKIRRAINGGYNGWADVVNMTAKAGRIWTEADFIDAPSKAKKPKLVAANDAKDSDVLELGSEGVEVIKLQEALSRAGNFAGRVDGDFGQLTLGALVAFQAQRGFEATGKIRLSDDDEVWLALKDAKPIERKVEEADLADSETITIFGRIKEFGKWLVTLPGAVLISDAGGLEPLEAASTYLTKFKSLAETYMGLGGWFVKPSVIMSVLAILAGWMLIHWARKGITNRVEDARSARNLGA